MFDIMLIGADKWQHFIFYSLIAFILSFLLCILPPLKNGLRRIATLWVALIVISLLEEYRQLYEPNRTAEFLDGVANIAGISFGVTLPLFFHFIWRYQHQNVERKRTFFSFVAIAVLLLTPLLYGLHIVNEPIPQMAASYPTNAFDTMNQSNTSLGSSPLTTPEAIVQTYRFELEELNQHANEEIEQLAHKALEEYKKKDVPLQKLLPTYIDQANELEERIHHEFQQIYERAKLDLEAHHFDSSYADVLKKEYKEVKEATKASMLQKATAELF